MFKAAVLAIMKICFSATSLGCVCVGSWQLIQLIQREGGRDANVSIAMLLQSSTEETLLYESTSRFVFELMGGRNGA